MLAIGEPIGDPYSSEDEVEELEKLPVLIAIDPEELEGLEYTPNEEVEGLE